MGTWTTALTHATVTTDRFREGESSSSTTSTETKRATDKATKATPAMRVAVSMPFPDTAAATAAGTDAVKA
jgi:hypothetical protein